MIYSGIIWNTAYEHRKEILSDISDKYRIVDAKTFNMKNNYKEFIIDVYLDDNITAWGWKLDKKIECMESFDEKKAISFDIEINNPSFEFVDRKNKYVCSEAEDLKAKIRNKYSKIITPYFYDTILHMTDDLQQTLQLRKTLHKYRSFTEDILFDKSEPNNSIVNLLKSKNNQKLK